MGENCCVNKKENAKRKCNNNNSSTRQSSINPPFESMYCRSSKLSSWFSYRDNLWDTPHIWRGWNKPPSPSSCLKSALNYTILLRSWPLQQILIFRFHCNEYLWKNNVTSLVENSNCIRQRNNGKETERTIDEKKTSTRLTMKFVIFFKSDYLVQFFSTIQPIK